MHESPMICWVTQMRAVRPPMIRSALFRSILLRPALFFSAPLRFRHDGIVSGQRLTAPQRRVRGIRVA